MYKECLTIDYSRKRQSSSLVSTSRCFTNIKTRYEIVPINRNTVKIRYLRNYHPNKTSPSILYSPKNSLLFSDSITGIYLPEVIYFTLAGKQLGINIIIRLLDALNHSLALSCTCTFLFTTLPIINCLNFITVCIAAWNALNEFTIKLKIALGKFWHRHLLPIQYIQISS